MKPQQIYILIALATILVVLILKILLLKKKNIKPQVSPFAGLAFAFLIAGIVFGEDRSIGYSLVGAGLLFAVIDLAKKLKKK